MSKCVLINNSTMRILAVTENLEAAEYWAELLVPQTQDYLITGVENRNYSVYTQLELRLLYQQHRGDMPPDSIDYSKLVKGAVEIADSFPVDDTPVETLKARLGREIAPASPMPAPETRSPQSQGQKASSRPKQGSTTAKVWDIADVLASSGDWDISARAFRDEVIQACTQVYINSSTAATQFAKWKKDRLSR